jgi:hypothetical protein
MGCTIKESELELRWVKKFLLLRLVQTGSGIHPDFYPMGTGGCFPKGEAV